MSYYSFAAFATANTDNEDFLCLRLTLFLAILVGVAYVLYRNKNEICQRSYPPIPTGLKTGFQCIVQQTATNIQKDAAAAAKAADSAKNGSSCEESPDVTLLNPPNGSGIVYVPDFSIVHKRSGDRVGGNGKAGRSILTIQFRKETNDAGKIKRMNGWTIQGTRRGAEQGSLYAIEQGFLVASSGKAYWVETNSKESILVVGTWHGSGDFEGEWLSSTGKRGPYRRQRDMQEEEQEGFLVNDNHRDHSDMLENNDLETPLMQAKSD